MTPYGGMEPGCRSLDPDVLESTFWYPGPMNVEKAPGEPAALAWAKAAEICIECPLYIPCRERHWGEEYGVWGGTTQHERYLHRRQLSRRLTAMSPVERSQLAARLHARNAGGRGRSPAALARLTGYSEGTVKNLIAVHQAVVRALQGADEERDDVGLTADERERLARLAARGESLRTMCMSLHRAKPTILRALKSLNTLPTQREVPQWPQTDPPVGDGWVWHQGIARTGHYLGETADGQWLYMSLRGQNRSPTKKWLPRDLVDLRRGIAVCIRERGKSRAA